MTPREQWTDERLDDLNKKVDDGFARVAGDIKDFRGEMNDRLGTLEGRLGGDIREVRSELKNINRILFMGVVGIVVALIGCLSALAGIALF